MYVCVHYNRCYETTSYQLHQLGEHQKADFPIPILLILLHLTTISCDNDDDMPCAVIVDQYEGLGESFISNGAKDKKLEGFYTFLIVKDKTAKSSKKSCCDNRNTIPMHEFKQTTKNHA